MTSDRVHGFAIVGCGVIAPIHARCIASLPAAELRAVVDVVPERAARLAAEFGGAAYTDLAAALARPDVDVVCVCVPSGLHAEVGVQAAAAGKHVICEKPIDISLAAADRLIAACREHGVKLAVISQHRFRPGVRRLRAALEAGRFERLILGNAVMQYYRTQEYYDSGDWRGTWALDGGGALMNQGVHYVDLLQWVMGPVEQVVARTATAAHDIAVEDLAVGIVTFRGGALGTIQGSTAVYGGLREALEIVGVGGAVMLEAGEVTSWRFRDERGAGDTAPGRGGQAPAEPVATMADPAALRITTHRAQIADLLAAIAADRDPVVTGEEARKPLEIILALYASARTGRAVPLPLAATR